MSDLAGLGLRTVTASSLSCEILGLLRSPGSHRMGESSYLFHLNLYFFVLLKPPPFLLILAVDVCSMETMVGRMKRRHMSFRAKSFVARFRARSHFFSLFSSSLKSLCF